jgi:PHP domain
MMLKGAMHAHSTYSDGEFTLDELRRIYAAENCSFICITDHAEYFDSQSVQAYAKELQSRSDQEFCFVMGLEYTCDRGMHILGYGASALAASKDPQAVIRHIKAQGAIAVIAHPKDDSFSWIESFDALPKGIETWNSKYDGRYAPRPGTFALLQRLRTRDPGMQAFYGQDLHWKKQFRGLKITVECESLNPPAILAALASGKYSGIFSDRGAELILPSSGVLPQAQLLAFERAHARSRGMRQLLKNGKQTLDRFGIRVPESLKTQLRRIF